MSLRQAADYHLKKYFNVFFCECDVSLCSLEEVPTLCFAISLLWQCEMADSESFPPHRETNAACRPVQKSSLFESLNGVQANKYV